MKPVPVDPPSLAEELDAHRKRAQAQHGVGLTDLYNVLEKVRAASAGDATPSSRSSARAAEEAKGIVRWLRPDSQKPLFADEKPSALGLDDSETVGAGLPRDSSGRKSRHKAAPTKKAKAAWPSALAERVRTVEQTLAAAERPATAADLATRFARAKAPDILEILQTLVTLGRARRGDAPGTFVR